MVCDPVSVNEWVEKMQKFRGAIEGGVCVRRFESYRKNSEIRYFVLRGVAHGPSDDPVPDIVRQCAERIDSPFFSVDIAVRDDGVLRVVEIGDGQVSDRVGWSVDRFVAMWNQ